jgi:hypothetical protein
MLLSQALLAISTTKATKTAKSGLIRRLGISAPPSA